MVQILFLGPLGRPSVQALVKLTGTGNTALKRKAGVWVAEPLLCPVGEFHQASSNGSGSSVENKGSV